MAACNPTARAIMNAKFRSRAGGVCESGAAKAMAMAAADPINQRWQEYMAPLMDVGSGIKDGSTAYLVEAFHLG